MQETTRKQKKVQKQKVFDGKEYKLDSIFNRANVGVRYINNARNRAEELRKEGYFARFYVQLSGRDSRSLVYYRKR